MRVRAIRDLCQLQDSQFLASVAEGLDLVLRNAAKLYEGAASVRESSIRACKVLEAIAEEESAKFLILMDAVRCPRQPSQRLAEHLRRFAEHLAKGLYARACMMRPTSLGQLQEYIDQCRDEFYLDGPNDVDWIFRNEIIQRREGSLYVDYVATDDGHGWADPGQFDSLLFGAIEPLSLRMARALTDVGLASAEGLSVVAEVWRGAKLDADTTWGELRVLNLRTLQVLEAAGHLRQQSRDVYSWVCNEWQFPMYDLDLRLARVDLDDLRERQRRWGPDW